MAEDAMPEGPTRSEAFRDLAASWFRLETLQAYDVGSDREPFEAFLRTGKIDASSGAEWREMIGRHVAAGRSLQRVHVVEEPLSDYLRYEIAAYKLNNAAGEEIGLIPVAHGEWPEGLPRDLDFWLIDDGEPGGTAWAMDYDEDGSLRGDERVRDPEVVESYRRWRDTALALAVPLNEYIRQGV